MKIKHKIRFTLACVVYVVTYFLLCIILEMGGRDRIMDHLLLGLAISNGPVKFHYGVLKMSPNIFLWVCLSTLLIPYILWQTTLSGPKLNRACLICLGINLVPTCFSRGIVEWIEHGAGEGISSILVVLIVLFAVIGLGISLSCWIQKRHGRLNSYEAYSDIMTQEEYYMWQARKIMKKKKRKK